MAQVVFSRGQERNALIVSLGEPISFRDRVRHEFDLLKQQWYLFLISIFVLLYGSVVVFRNLAFYRFKAKGERLEDLGYELIPQVNGFASAPTDMLLGMDILVAIVLGYCFVGNHSNWQKPYAINLLLRVLMIVAFGHVLRFFAFISTTLPGAADYCLLPNGTKTTGPLPNQPTSLLECFTRIELNMDANCGDLMFSGHMLQAVTLGMFLQTYTCDILGIRQYWYKAFITFVWLYVTTQAVMIVSLRHHYTSDVVVASFVAPLLWYAYDLKFRPTDPAPRNLVLQLSDVQVEDFEDESFAYQQLDDTGGRRSPLWE